VHYRAGDYRAARAAAAEAVMIDGGRWADPLVIRAICEWQTGDRVQPVGTLRQARHLTRSYRDEGSAAEALVLSHEQLSVLRDIMRAGYE